MNFSEALKELKAGKTIRRKIWIKTGHLRIENRVLSSCGVGVLVWDEIYMQTTDLNGRKLIALDCEDILSDDWEIFSG